MSFEQKGHLKLFNTNSSSINISNSKNKNKNRTSNEKKTHVKCNTLGVLWTANTTRLVTYTQLIPQISYNCIRNDGSKWPKMYQITNKEGGDYTHL